MRTFAVIATIAFVFGSFSAKAEGRFVPQQETSLINSKKALSDLAWKVDYRTQCVALDYECRYRIDSVHSMEDLLDYAEAEFNAIKPELASWATSPADIVEDLSNQYGLWLKANLTDSSPEIQNLLVKNFADKIPTLASVMSKDRTFIGSARGRASFIMTKPGICGDKYLVKMSQLQVDDYAREVATNISWSRSQLAEFRKQTAGMDKRSDQYEWIRSGFEQNGFEGVSRTLFQGSQNERVERCATLLEENYKWIMERAQKIAVSQLPLENLCTDKKEYDQAVKGIEVSHSENLNFLLGSGPGDRLKVKCESWTFRWPWEAEVPDYEFDSTTRALTIHRFTVTERQPLTGEHVTSSVFGRAVGEILEKAKSK